MSKIHRFDTFGQIKGEAIHVNLFKFITPNGALLSIIQCHFQSALTILKLAKEYVSEVAALSYRV